MIRIPNGIDKYVADSKARFKLDKNDRVLPAIFTKLDNNRKDFFMNDRIMDKTNFDSVLQQEIKKISLK